MGESFVSRRTDRITPAGLAVATETVRSVVFVGRIALGYVLLFGQELMMSGLAIRYKRAVGIYQTLSLLERLLAGTLLYPEFDCSCRT